MKGGFLLDQLGDRFTLMTINVDAPETLDVDGVEITNLALTSEGADPALTERYLGGAAAAVYLIRPDQHVAARWANYDETAVRAALRRAIGKE